jgi:hypothetical protein
MEWSKSCKETPAQPELSGCQDEDFIVVADDELLWVAAPNYTPRPLRDCMETPKDDAVQLLFAGFSGSRSRNDGAA